MNQENFERFSAAYRASLQEAVEKYPKEYFYTAEQAPQVASKMLAEVASKPRMVNYTGHGFRGACKTLGIKNTRKAIFEYLGIGGDRA